MKRTVLIFGLLCIMAGAAVLAQETPVVKKSYFLNGNLRKEERILNEKRHGLFRHYYHSGSCKLEAHYKNGVLDGVARRYYPGGSLQDEWMFKNGVPDGEARRYLPNGDVLHVLFYVTGRLQYVDNYKNGEKVSRKEFRHDEHTDFEAQYPPLTVD